jgi:surface protein
MGRHAVGCSGQCVYDQPYRSNSKYYLKAYLDDCKNNFNATTQTCETVEKRCWSPPSGTSPGTCYYFGHVSTWNLAEAGSDLSELFEGWSNFNINIGAWDVSRVTNFNEMFKDAVTFDQDISNWDMSNAQQLVSMFEGALSFDRDISGWTTTSLKLLTKTFKNAKKFTFSLDGWDVSKVTDMTSLFEGAELFNGIITNWVTSSVTSMSRMFFDAKKFNRNLNAVGSKWNTASVSNMKEMFKGALEFNGEVENWNTRAVTTMESMFENCKSFNQDVSTWIDLRKVTSMSRMFKGCTTFNKPLNSASWKLGTASVTTMKEMFSGATSMNGLISGWKLGSVTNMAYMFFNAKLYNQPISSSNTTWIMTAVNNVEHMFDGAEAFDQNISSWDVSNIVNADSMFLNAKVFNSPLSHWRLSAALTTKRMFKGALLFNQTINSWGSSLKFVTNMDSMFHGAESFDQHINNWDVSSVKSFNSMFKSAIFNRDISDWNVVAGENFNEMFRLNFQFQYKSSLDTKWKAKRPNSHFYPGTNMYGKVVPQNLCLNPIDYDASACSGSITAAGKSPGNLLYDLDWASFSCDDEGSTFPQGVAPYVNKLAEQCCPGDGIRSSVKKSVCSNNKVRNGFKATSYSRLCMDPTKYKPDFLTSSGESCDQRLSQKQIYKNIDWSTFSCGDTAEEHEDDYGCSYSADPCVCKLRCPTGKERFGDGSACREISDPTNVALTCDLGYCHGNANPTSLAGMGKCETTDLHAEIILDGSECCDSTPSSCHKCPNNEGLTVNTGACVCGTSLCTNDEFYPFERFTSSKIVVTAHKKDGTAVGGTLADRKKAFTVESLDDKIEFHTKDDGNEVAVDLGFNQEEPIARCAIQIMQDHAAAYSVQVEYADDDDKGILGFRDSFGFLGKWDSKFLSGSMTSGNSIFSNNDQTFTGGGAGGGGMPVSNFAMDLTQKYSSFYVEVTVGHDGDSHTMNVGIHDLSDSNDFTSNDDFTQQGISIRSDGKLIIKRAGNSAASVSSYGETFSNNDVIGIYYNAENDNLWFYKNGKDLGSGSPAVINVKTILTKAFVFGYSGKGTDSFTMNSGQSEFKRASPRDWKKVVSQNHASSTNTEYISWEPVGSHRYWKIVFSNWVSTNNTHITDLMFGKKVVTGLYCTKSRNKCSKIGKSNKRFICSNPSKYMGSALVDVNEPDNPQYSETCDSHLGKSVWSGVTWSSAFQCKDTPIFMKALEFMGVAGRCCSDGRTVCWEDYERICSLSGKAVSMKRLRITSSTKVNSEYFTDGTLIGCG